MSDEQAPPSRLRNLKIKRVSICDSPANEHARVMLFKSVECGCAEVCKGELGGESRGNLSDGDFAAVWTDSDGKKQRKLPIHDAAHVRNALARFNQTDMPASVKAKARAKLDAAAKKFGIGQEKAMKQEDTEPDADDMDKAGRKCAKCGKAVGGDAAFCPNCGAKMPAGGKSMAKSAVDLEKIADPEVRKAVEQLAADLEAALATASEEETKRVEAEKKLKAAQPAPAEEDVLKNLPEPVRKRLEKAEADAKKANDAILKMADEKREREFVAKARTYDAISVKADTFGLVLKRVADGTSTEKDVAEIHRVLTGANALAKRAVFKQVGRSDTGAGAGSAYEEILTKAKEHREAVMKSGDKITLQEAIDHVCKQEPDLYERHVAEIPTRRRGSMVNTVGAPEPEDEEE